MEKMFIQNNRREINLKILLLPCETRECALWLSHVYLVRDLWANSGGKYLQFQGLEAHEHALWKQKVEAFY